MKSKLHLIPVAVAFVCALTAPAAMAHEFTQSPAKAGFQIKGGTQTIREGELAVECAEASGTGSSQQEKSVRLPVALKYGGCKALGAKQVKVSRAELKLNASETLSLIEEPIVVRVELTLAGECEVTIPAAPNENLGKVIYTNLTEGLAAKIAVTGVTYEVKEKNAGGICGKAGEKAKTGEYKGEGVAEAQIKGAGEICNYAGPWSGQWFDERCTEKGTPKQDKWTKAIVLKTILFT